MKKLLFTLIICLSALMSFADSVLIEGFEYANQDMAVPIGWISDDQSWLCGKFDKDHNRTAHSGNWYAFTNADDSWMFMDLFMTNQLRYRYSCWAISDGSYRLEIWGGNEPTAEGMTQMVLCDTVDSGEYKYFSSSMQHLAPSCQYLGIHAVALDDAYYLTIDDLIVELVNKYDLIVDPAELDTVMYPGTEVTFTYEVHNIGYLDLVVFANAYGDEFSNVQFTADGATGALGSTFNTDPDQTVLCTCTATLSPGIPAGTRCWLDIMFTVSCDCLTRMATIFVDVLGETDEFPVEASFDTEAFYKDGWVLGDGMPKWEWTDEGEGVLPYDDSQGMLYFPASQTAASALLFSPKVVLDETDNHMRMMLYRDGEHANNEDRVNVYFNDILSIHGATPLGTVHRSTSLSPEAETPGWYDYELSFDCPARTGFLIFEAVGDRGGDLYIDNISVSNEPLPAPTTVNEQAISKVQVAPNPVKDAVQVIAEGLTHVDLMDLTGRVLLSSDANDEKLILDMSALKPGVYFIVVASEGGTSTHKIVKQ